MSAKSDRFCYSKFLLIQSSITAHQWTSYGTNLHLYTSDASFNNITIGSRHNGVEASTNDEASLIYVGLVNGEIATCTIQESDTICLSVYSMELNAEIRNGREIRRGETREAAADYSIINLTDKSQAAFV